MPYKDPEKRKQYRNDYYAKLRQDNPDFVQKRNLARNKHLFVCENCKKEGLGRKGKRFCCQSCATAWQWANNEKKPGKISVPDERKKVTNSKGYVLLYKPDHPNCDKKGYVLEHRFVMEEHLGRLLTTAEWVHHKNSNRTDNSLDNLEIVTHATHRGLVQCPNCQCKFQLH